MGGCRRRDRCEDLDFGVRMWCVDLTDNSKRETVYCPDWMIDGGYFILGNLISPKGRKGTRCVVFAIGQFTDDVNMLGNNTNPMF